MAGPFFYRALKVAGPFFYRALKVAGPFFYRALKVAGPFFYRALKVAGTLLLASILYSSPCIIIGYNTKSGGEPTPTRFRRHGGQHAVMAAGLRIGLWR